VVQVHSSSVKERIAKVVGTSLLPLFTLLSFGTQPSPDYSRPTCSQMHPKSMQIHSSLSNTRQYWTVPSSDRKNNIVTCAQVHLHRQTSPTGLPHDFHHASAPQTLSRTPITSTPTSFSNLPHAISDTSAVPNHQSPEINANPLVFHILVILHHSFR